MSISLLLDQHLTIQRQQITRDASGGATRTFATLLSGVACSVMPASTSMSGDYARRDMTVDHHIYITADLNGLIDGGLRLGDRLTDGNNFYLVKAVKKSANSMVSGEVLYQVDCERK